MQELLSVIKANDSLMSNGSVSEYLPAYAELTFSFNEGLTARIADHGNGTYQATLDGFFSLEPATADELVSYLASL